ncbi:MAG: hypothetical protein ABW162_05675 [Candidatus Sedimenticola sp. PURPLELP]
MKLWISVFSLVLFGLSLPVLAETTDHRTAIKIPAKFKPQILADMRKNLETIQGIVVALSSENFDRVAELASELGSMDHSDEVIQRRTLMPEAYRGLGPQMHLGFQAIARDARDFGDVNHSLEQLAALMAICTSCHANYRLEVSD